MSADVESAATAHADEMPKAPEHSPAMLGKIGELRTQMQLSIGQVVLAVVNEPRYRHLPIGDIGQLLIEPLLRDRVSIALRQTDDAGKSGENIVAGIALWASVSDAVDSKLSEQVQAGLFPVRLAPEDWVSGEHIWLLDLMAADRRHATLVLANFRQVCGEKPVKIHPFIGRLIDPDVLRKISLTSSISK